MLLDDIAPNKLRLLDIPFRYPFRRTSLRHSRPLVAPVYLLAQSHSAMLAASTQIRWFGTSSPYLKEFVSMTGSRDEPRIPYRVSGREEPFYAAVKPLRRFRNNNIRRAEAFMRSKGEDPDAYAEDTQSIHRVRRLRRDIDKIEKDIANASEEERNGEYTARERLARSYFAGLDRILKTLQGILSRYRRNAKLDKRRQDPLLKATLEQAMTEVRSMADDWLPRAAEYGPGKDGSIDKRIHAVSYALKEFNAMGGDGENARDAAKALRQIRREAAEEKNADADLGRERAVGSEEKFENMDKPRTINEDEEFDMPGPERGAANQETQDWHPSMDANVDVKDSEDLTNEAVDRRTDGRRSPNKRREMKREEDDEEKTTDKVRYIPEGAEDDDAEGDKATTAEIDVDELISRTFEDVEESLGKSKEQAERTASSRKAAALGRLERLAAANLEDRRAVQSLKTFDETAETGSNQPKEDEGSAVIVKYSSLPPSVLQKMQDIARERLERARSHQKPKSLVRFHGTAKRDAEVESSANGSQVEGPPRDRQHSPNHLVNGNAEGSGSTPEIPRLTHVNKQGTANMVNVGAKQPTSRVATAVSCVLFTQRETFELVHKNTMAKGDVLGVAKLAGIMAAKRTSEIIPLCHSIALSNVAVDLELFSGEPSWQTDLAIRISGVKKSRVMRGGVVIEARAESVGQTGVEMEALHAVTVAGLTVYDMCKAADKTMNIGRSFVVQKQGGKSGDWTLSGWQPLESFRKDPYKRGLKDNEDNSEGRLLQESLLRLFSGLKGSEQRNVHQKLHDMVENPDRTPALGQGGFTQDWLAFRYLTRMQQKSSLFYMRRIMDGHSQDYMAKMRRLREKTDYSEENFGDDDVINEEQGEDGKDFGF